MPNRPSSGFPDREPIVATAVKGPRPTKVRIFASAGCHDLDATDSDCHGNYRERTSYGSSIARKRLHPAAATNAFAVCSGTYSEADCFRGGRG